jgi:phage minor structural protein
VGIVAYTASVRIMNASRQSVAWLENCLYPGYSFRINEVYTAHFSLPADDAKAIHLVPRSLFELYENDGTSKGIFRIVDIEHTRMGKGVLITCRGEHVISTLLDDMLVGEHEIAQSGATPTTHTAIDYVLAVQTTARWQLGTEAFARNFWYRWKDKSLLSALFGIPAAFGQDYIWTYTTASYPWTVTLAVPDAAVSGYIAYNKNLEGIRKRQMTSEMYNRIYPYGYGEYPNQLTIASVNSGIEYLEDATGVAAYGRIARVWNDQRYTDATSLKTAAQKLLTDHAAAPIYYEVEAADLSQLSDADVAALEVGSLVKVYDSEMGVSVDVRVVTITKPDMLGQPGACSLELANKVPEFDIEDDYTVPDTEDVTGTVGNLVPNYSFERLSGTVPLWWTCDGWEQSTEEAFDGVRSLKGTGTAKTAYSDKQTLPRSISDLLVKGHAKALSSTPNPAELGTAVTTSAPLAYCQMSGTLVAVPRQNAGYDIIDLYDASNSAALYKVGSIDESGGAEHRSTPFRIYGDYLFCVAVGHLYVYDISTPSAPAEIEDYTLDSGTAVVRSLVVRNWVVFLGCDEGASDFIEIVSASTPSSLAQFYAGTPASSPSATRTWKHRDIGIVGDDLIVLKSDGAYISPAGTASGSGWTNPTNAVDGATATLAFNYDVAAGAWTDYLIMPIGSTVSVDGARWYLNWTTSAYPTLEVDVYNADALAWENIYAGTPTNSNVPLAAWYGATISPLKNINSIRLRFKNNAVANTANFRVYEVERHSHDTTSGTLHLVAYDVTDKAAPIYKCNATGTDLENLAVNGTHYYVTCGGGAGADKIAIYVRAGATSITGPTYVGGAGAPSYTGTDALFMAGGFLANVGAGTSASYYAVSYWSVAVPGTPTLAGVNAAILGDMDAATGWDSLVVGVDVDNSKVRALTAEGAAWAMAVRFYDVLGTLLDTITVYDGETSLPVTTASWCRFETTIPLADISQSAEQLDVLLEANTGADSVYVDALSITGKDAG